MERSERRERVEREKEKERRERERERERERRRGGEKGEERKSIEGEKGIHADRQTHRQWEERRYLDFFGLFYNNKERN